MTSRALVGSWFLLAGANLLAGWLLDPATAFFFWSLAASFLWNFTRRHFQFGAWSRILSAIFVFGVLVLFLVTINAAMNDAVVHGLSSPGRPRVRSWWLAIVPFVPALAVAYAGRKLDPSRRNPGASAT